MIFPELTDERIEVRKFLAIRRAEMSVNQLTAVIGPQASGKSICVKLIFFFRKYISDLLKSAVFSDTGRPAFNNQKIEEFFELFGGAETQQGAFEVTYTAADIEISIRRKSGEHKPRISTSTQLSSLFTRAKNDYKKFLREEDLRATDQDDFLRDTGYSGYTSSAAQRSQFARSIPTVLFVPASRAFFSVIRDEVFTLLSAQKTLDPLMVQFGRFYRIARSRYERELRLRRTLVGDGALSEYENVLGGRYARRSNKDFIETSWGEVELPNSSSGQQESLPLILTLLEYPSKFRKNDLIIIEEPEAHLFPEAQREITQLIVDTAIRRHSKILFTTHSPYMIACLNNCILRTPDLGTSAFLVQDGAAENIFDIEDGLVDMDALDEVSQRIASEYMELIGE